MVLRFGTNGKFQHGEIEKYDDKKERVKNP